MRLDFFVVLDIKRPYWGIYDTISKSFTFADPFYFSRIDAVRAENRKLLVWDVRAGNPIDGEALYFSPSIQSLSLGSS